MKELFCPSSVVVIGVSTKPFNLGKVIAWNLTEFGFDEPGWFWHRSNPY